MDAPEFPSNEVERLQSLVDLSLLDTPAEERFDRITRLAARSLDTEIALVSLVDGDRQWFKSAVGLETPETGRDISFCGHAILSTKPLIIPDARMDVRFSDNPLVTGEPNIRFYAGYPLQAPNGATVGTLCVIDSKPRKLSEDDIASLRDLAMIVQSELLIERMTVAERELRAELHATKRQASIDSLTRLWNREAIMRLLNAEVSRCQRQKSNIGLMMIDIDHFKGVNDTWGHPAGDRAIREVTARIRAGVRGADSVGRFGGEEFMVIAIDCDAQAARMVAERIRKCVSADPIDLGAAKISMTVSIGLWHGVPLSGRSSPSTLLEEADQALYCAKREGRDRVVLVAGKT